jgi:hypothetical protein
LSGAKSDTDITFIFVNQNRRRVNLLFQFAATPACVACASAPRVRLRRGDATEFIRLFLIGINGRCAATPRMRRADGTRLIGVRAPA